MIIRSNSIFIGGSMGIFTAIAALEGVSHATEPNKPVEGLSLETLALARGAVQDVPVIYSESSYLSTPSTLEPSGLSLTK